MKKNTFMNVAGAISLRIATYPAEGCFQGLLMVHEDLLKLTWSGVSSAEVFFRARYVTRGGDKR